MAKARKATKRKPAKMAKARKRVAKKAKVVKAKKKPVRKAKRRVAKKAKVAKAPAKRRRRRAKKRSNFNSYAKRGPACRAFFISSQFL